MRVALVGIGRVGSLALRLFAEEYPDAEIIAVDKFDRSNIIKGLGDSIAFHRAHEPLEVSEIVRNADVVATALPSDTALPVVRELLTRGQDVVDVSFMDIDPYMFENLCKKNGSFYIFDAGFSPGFSNLVAGYVQYDGNVGPSGDLYRRNSHTTGTPPTHKVPDHLKSGGSHRRVR